MEAFLQSLATAPSPVVRPPRKSENPVAVPNEPKFPVPRPQTIQSTPIQQYSSPTSYSPPSAQLCNPSSTPELKTVPLPSATSECHVPATANLPEPPMPRPALW